MRSTVRRFILELALFATVASACAAQTPQCPIPVPPDTVDVTGDGELIAHPVGRQGGALRLGPGHAPALLVPSGALDDSGLAVSMRKADAHSPNAKGAALSEPFEVSPPVEARTPQVFTFTLPIEQLPSDCAEERLRFAVERPNDVGPADGRGSPTLLWEYDRVSFNHAVLVAALPRIHGNRMQFVCLPEGAQ